MIEPACERLDDYLAAALPPDERSAFEAHLAQCAECADAVGVDRRLGELMARAVVRPVVDRTTLVCGIERRLRRARRVRAARWIGMTAAAMVVAVAVIIPSLPDAWQFATSPIRIQPRWDDEPHRVEERISDKLVARVTPQNAEETLIVSLPSTHPNVTIVWVYPTFKPSVE